jgi:hypothetical protein
MEFIFWSKPNFQCAVACRGMLQNPHQQATKSDAAAYCGMLRNASAVGALQGRLFAFAVGDGPWGQVHASKKKTKNKKKENQLVGQPICINSG